jgi:molybdate transport system substrate-binding protein
MAGIAAIRNTPPKDASMNTAVHGAELRVLSAIAMQTVMEDLGPKFERATGHKLAITFATLGAVVKRVQDGETADVVVIPQQGIQFIKVGKLRRATSLQIALDHGLAVRSGARRPDISASEAFARALLGQNPSLSQSGNRRRG